MLGTALVASPDFVPLEWQKLIDLLPFQTSLCLTLPFYLKELSIICRIVSVRMHDYLHFSCLETTTTELKGKQLDYFNHLHELIIVKN